jgi:hypothetical protein
MLTLGHWEAALSQGDSCVLNEFLIFFTPEIFGGGLGK